VKLALPVATIAIASGTCCCCGGDFFQGMQSGFEEAMQGQDGTEVTVTADGGDDAPAGGGGGVVSAGGTALEGACGRFKEMGITAPAGTKVTICTTDPGSGDSLIATTEAGPDDACKHFAAWGTSQGFSTDTESTFGGSHSVLQSKGSDQLVIACLTIMGKNNATMTLSPRL